MDSRKKGKYIGWAGALLVHLLLLLLLLLVGVVIPQPEEEGGIPVLMGEVPQAGGLADPSLVEVTPMPDPAPQPAPAPPTVVEQTSAQELLTQESEETVAIPPKKKETSKKKETPKKEVKKPKETPQKTPQKQVEIPKPEKSEAEKAEEARRLAEAKAERERKAAEEAARKRVAGAFGKGAQMGNKGTATGEGVQGSPTGNSDTGATSGVGGYGSFSLNGRSLGPGGLPRPTYNVQDEGRVVVTITVNPAGEVIATSINRQTNTVNTALRRAAEEAARKARFNQIDGVGNQTGTITYHFKLK